MPGWLSCHIHKTFFVDPKLCRVKQLQKYSIAVTSILISIRTKILLIATNHIATKLHQCVMFYLFSFLFYANRLSSNLCSAILDADIKFETSQARRWRLQMNIKQRRVTFYIRNAENTDSNCVIQSRNQKKICSGTNASIVMFEVVVINYGYVPQKVNAQIK